MESPKAGFPPFPHSLEIPSGLPHSHSFYYGNYQLISLIGLFLSVIRGPISSVKHGFIGNIIDGFILTALAGLIKTIIGGRNDRIQQVYRRAPRGARGLKRWYDYLHWSAR